MKKTQIKDSTRTIKKHFISWLSILIISMLAILTFVGVNHGATGLYESGLRFYEQTNFRDVEMISSLLFSSRDIEDIKALDPVADAEGKQTITAKISSTEDPFLADVSSLTERINVPVLVEGRLPESTEECVIEKGASKTTGLKTGDTVTLKGDDGSKPDFLKRDSFKITGIILAPDQAASSQVTAGNQVLMVKQDAFDMGENAGCYFRTLVRFNDTKDLSRFSSEYDDAVKNGIEILEDLAKVNTTRRTEEMKDAAKKKLNEKQKELDDGKEQLISKKTDLDIGEFKLEQGEQQAKDGEAQLSNAATELASGKDQLDSGKKALSDAEAQLLDGWVQIEDGKEQARQTIKNALYAAVEGDPIAEAMAHMIVFESPSYNVNLKAPNVRASEFKITPYLSINLNLLPDISADPQLLKDYICEIIDETPSDISPEEREKLKAAVQQSDIDLPLSDNINKAINGVKQWDAGHAKYLESLSQYNAGLTEYQEGQEKYNAGIAELDANLKTLEDAKKQLADGKIQYEEYSKKLDDATEELAKAKAQIDNLTPCSWVLLDPSFNFSFSNVKSSAENVRSLGIYFASVFIIVAALVIYTTVGKLIEDQRKLLGAAKALGFFGREIFFKYLLFGLSASLIGMVLGLIFGHLALQNFVLKSYGALYVYPEERGMIPSLMIILLIGGVVLTVFSVYAACFELLKAPARELMQEKMPPTNNRSKKKKSRLPLQARIILLNIKNDKKRIIVTIASIAGCAVMMVTGFTMRTSIIGSVQNQFTTIMHYQLEVDLSKSAKQEDMKEISSMLEKAGASSIHVTSENIICEAKDKLSGYNLICADLDQLQDYYSMRDHETKKPLDVKDDGIFLNYTAARQMGLSEGDTLLVYGSDMHSHPARVAEIFDVNLGQYLLISKESYKEIYGKDCSENAFLVKTNGADQKNLTDDLNDNEKIMGVKATETQRKSIENITSMTNYLALIMVFLAGLMSYFILLNLVNMNINQKKRELTIMRINGFTVREVKAYIQKESIASTVIGIIIGLILGQLLSIKVLSAIEGSILFFMKNIQWSAWLLAAAITAVFAFVINAIALRQVKNLNLSDMQ